ncbi:MULTISPECIES: cation:proton antiporter [unclassified Prochlorococcus]|uniref:cation:proton antiporter n=1 Tax=unclassified Prochlorococcus TaxID=2627481 RepID=UPI00053385A2|nr:MULTISPECIES: cation:proton antiporter [unclassified Prochlorococcus]KGG14629.1 Na+/H+ antiporter [Prochlorococcus sp. MIT 0602]KGG15942.1 Na+/H+ antiporter [Prochlorococcus sp. MIT 0603]
MLFSPVISVLSTHDIEVAETLIGVIRFLLIFVAARVLAEVLVRLSLPTIVGELLAGVLIGASGLHLLLPPNAHASLNEGFINVISSLASIPPEAVPDLYFETFPSLQAVATLGLYALLFLTGLESELEELVAVGAQAFTVAMAGVILPFAFGTFGLMFIFNVDLIPAIFAGASMTATSIGITASVFGELGYLKTREGQIVIGAAVLDDILGIVILAVVVALATGGSLEIAPIVKLVVAATVFVIAAIALSRTAAPAFDWLLDRLKAPGAVVVASFVILVLSCFVATAIGLEAALGAFAAGLILSSSKNNHAIQQSVLPLVSLFATIFFVLVGAGMDLSVINPLDPASRSALIVAGFLLIVAIAGKIASGWSFVIDKPTNRLVVGLGMMPRGEVGLIFLGLGTSAGLLTPSLEAAILLMVIGTTFLAPVLLRIVLKDKKPGGGNSIPDEVAADPVGLI